MAGRPSPSYVCRKRGEMCSLDVLAVVAKLAADCDEHYPMFDPNAPSLLSTPSSSLSPSPSPVPTLYSASKQQEAVQTGLLQCAYEDNRYPSKAERHRLATSVHKTERQVAVWFQNKRQRDKRLWESAATAAAAWDCELETTG